MLAKESTVLKSLLQPLIALIKRNYAYFVNILFTNEINRRKKMITFVSHFLGNIFMKMTIQMNVAMTTSSMIQIHQLHAFCT